MSCPLEWITGCLFQRFTSRTAFICSVQSDKVDQHHIPCHPCLSQKHKPWGCLHLGPVCIVFPQPTFWKTGPSRIALPITRRKSLLLIETNPFRRLPVGSRANGTVLFQITWRDWDRGRLMCCHGSDLSWQSRCVATDKLVSHGKNTLVMIHLLVLVLSGPSSCRRHHHPPSCAQSLPCMGAPWVVAPEAS